jgi:glycosyltransferase involved in cell wall biosynthesis
MNIRLSIIIPAYNASLYIEKCLRSCAIQDISPQEYEIIIINDGSKDNSHQIINSVINEYSNFKYIDKPNGGVSSARNAGLDIANGEYVWFVDADDWIEENCLSFLLDTMKNDNLDALQINAKEVAINGDITPYYLRKQDSSPILTPDIYLKTGYFEGYAHMTISRKSIIEKYNIRFNQSIKMREDLLFNLEVASYTERIQRLNINPYYYCIREFSASVIHDKDSNLLLLNEIRNLEKKDILKEFNEWLIPDYLYDHINQNIFDISKLIEELKFNGYRRVKFSPNSKLKVKLFFAFYNINFHLTLYLFHYMKIMRRQFKVIHNIENKQLLLG